MSLPQSTTDCENTGAFLLTRDVAVS
jgi:hypothetical protein